MIIKFEKRRKTILYELIVPGSWLWDNVGHAIYAVG